MVGKLELRTVVPTDFVTAVWLVVKTVVYSVASMAVSMVVLLVVETA